MSLRLGDRTVRRVAVLGFGTTGRAVCRYAVRHGVAVFVSELHRLSPGDRRWLAEHGIDHEEGGHSRRALRQVDALVPSPGVPMASPWIEGALRRGIPVYSELDVAALAAADIPIVGVTGTNGKSSTVRLISALLRFWGQDAPVAGNIGTPFLDIADAVERYDAVVVEASSYQLEQSVVLHPRVAIVLNLAPDHLERHGTMDAYAEAKGRLFRLQTADDTAIVPADLAARFPQGDARRVAYDRASDLPEGAERLSSHQRDNLRAALCACEALLPGVDRRDAPIERIEEALRLPHRMEELDSVDGIRVIDDSKATNPASTVAALRAVTGPLVLLLGGRPKSTGYDELVRAIAGAPVRRIVVFGEAADRLSDLLSGLPCDRAAGVEPAVDLGLRRARSGDTLLFSPACSSFDEFTDFEQRGERFAAAVRARSDQTAGAKDVNDV